MNSLLLTFENSKARDRFLNLLRELTEKPSSDTDLIMSALHTARLDPPIKTDSEREVSLFVSGQEMNKGNLVEMRKRFQQEIDTHRGNVELRELRNGKWITIQSRRMQQ